MLILLPIFKDFIFELTPLIVARVLDLVILFPLISSTSRKKRALSEDEVSGILTILPVKVPSSGVSGNIASLFLILQNVKKNPK